MRSISRRLALALAAVLASVAVVVGFPSSASAVTTQTSSCTDKGNHLWKGRAVWGGLIGGIAAVTAVVMWKKLGVARTSDSVAVALAAAYAVGRTGCWAVGDDYGRPWSGALSVKFPEGAPPSTAANMSSMFGVDFPAETPPNEVIAVHPTQLYEVAMGTIMFFILLRCRKHNHGDGWLFGFYCLLAGLERFIVEFFRAKDDRFFAAGLTVAQVIAIAFALFGAVWMMLKWNPPARAARA